MSEIKTRVSDASVQAFIEAVENPTRREDSFELVKLFTKLTGEEPKMWGSSIIGFGQYHYKSERSSQEGDWMLTGFSPRKQSLTLYVMHDFSEQTDLLQTLGKYKTGKGCLYINKLEDINLEVLKELIKKFYHDMKAAHGPVKL